MKIEYDYYSNGKSYHRQNYPNPPKIPASKMKETKPKRNTFKTKIRLKKGTNKKINTHRSDAIHLIIIYTCQYFKEMVNDLLPKTQCVRSLFEELLYIKKHFK